MPFSLIPSLSKTARFGRTLVGLPRAAVLLTSALLALATAHASAEDTTDCANGIENIQHLRLIDVSGKFDRDTFPLVVIYGGPSRPVFASGAPSSWDASLPSSFAFQPHEASIVVPYLRQLNESSPQLTHYQIQDNYQCKREPDEQCWGEIHFALTRVDSRLVARTENMPGKQIRVARARHNDIPPPLVGRQSDLHTLEAISPPGYCDYKVSFARDLGEFEVLLFGKDEGGWVNLGWQPVSLGEPLSLETLKDESGGSEDGRGFNKTVPGTAGGNLENKIPNFLAGSPRGKIVIQEEPIP